MNTEAVKQYLLKFQRNISSSLEVHEPSVCFHVDNWEKGKEETLQGSGISMVIEEGATIEKGGANFSHVKGNELPASATVDRGYLAGKPFEALGVSIVIHPRSPMVPTSHANVRLFIAYPEKGEAIWWFGGGFDLTPFYPIDEDIIAWHTAAKNACDAVREDLYPVFKKNCDDYFYLKHRDENRGVGGIFYDDINQENSGLDFNQSFELMQHVGDAYCQSYIDILARRKDMPYHQRHRDFQLYRRGRYVEFNLVYDRGTIFGLQSGGRAESILMSLPNIVHWRYDWQPEEDSVEAQLANYLKPRDWV